jgi:hypothetical protein
MCHFQPIADLHVRVVIEENGRIENVIIPDMTSDLTKATNKALDKAKTAANVNAGMEVTDTFANNTYSRYQIDYNPSNLFALYSTLLLYM